MKEKRIIVHTSNGLLLNLKKEEFSLNMDEPEEYYAKQDKYKNEALHDFLI